LTGVICLTAITRDTTMLTSYRQHVAERAALGIPPLPLTAQQTAEVIELLKTPPAGEAEFLVELLTHRVPAGVDDAAKVKASYLAALAHGTEVCSLISPERATELLGTMLGGYNVHPLIDLLDRSGEWVPWRPVA
jgi:aconitate hydratase 2/2-methylisocitrate dehydratase